MILELTASHVSTLAKSSRFVTRATRSFALLSKTTFLSTQLHNLHPILLHFSVSSSSFPVSGSYVPNSKSSSLPCRCRIPALFQRLNFVLWIGKYYMRVISPAIEAPHPRYNWPSKYLCPFGRKTGRAIPPRSARFRREKITSFTVKVHIYEILIRSVFWKLRY